MDPVTIGTAVSIGSSILGMAGGLSGQKKAKDAAKKQAELTYIQRMEEIRKLRQQQQVVVGENVARAYASGVRVQKGGSTARFLNQVQSDFAADLNYRRGSAKLEREAIRKGAPGQGSAFGTIASGIGSIANTLINYNR
jgi:hypothetical protein